MRLGYLLSEHPTPGHIFMQREIARLPQYGIDPQVVAISKPRIPAGLATPEQTIASSTFYVKHAGLRAMVAAHARSVSRGPLRYLRGLGYALRLGDWHPRRTAAALWYFVEAVVAGDWFTRRGIGHVHVHFSSTVALLMTRLFPLSISITFHGPDEFESPVAFHLAKKVEASRFVVAISHFAASQIRRYTPATVWDRIEVVPLGVEVSRIQPRAPRRDARPFRLLCAGRLAPVKGHRVLFDALARLVMQHPDLVLHVAGDGAERASLEAYARASGLGGHVIFEGLLDQVRLQRLYEQTDLFVLPTFAEGIPVVLMEAMAMEVPCVSTWVTGVPELIADGTNGLLTPPGDAAALAAAIDRLIGNPALRERLGQQGRLRVLERYDIDVNVRQLAQVLKQRLGGTTAPAVSGTGPVMAGAAATALGLETPSRG